MAKLTKLQKESMSHMFIGFNCAFLCGLQVATIHHSAAHYAWWEVAVTAVFAIGNLVFALPSKRAALEE
jgi:hypothetical protein